jgi:hypothetical protein
MDNFEVNENEILESNDMVVDEDSIVDNTFLVDETEENASQPIEVEAWTNPNDFVKYCSTSLRSAPQIKADNLNSLRRAVAYYDKLERAIIKGATADAEQAELSMDQLEVLDNTEENLNIIREQIQIAASRTSILKTASKSAGFVYVVDPFLFAIARLCINAKISNGKNIEDVFTKLASRFSINDREKFALKQIMRDMGYPIAGSFVGDEGSYDMIKQYFA